MKYLGIGIVILTFLVTFYPMVEDEFIKRLNRNGKK